MKKIGITQRLDKIESYGEIRTCLDYRWYKLLTSLGFIPIPLAVVDVSYIEDYVEQLNLDGILLSGGNSLSKIETDLKDLSLIRDTFETKLIDVAIEKKLKIFGVCRGMQFLNIYFGGDLKKVKDHIAVKHSIKNISYYEFPKKVNSFHEWGIPQEMLSNEMVPLALDNDENIEAMKHKNKNILAIMWHPEREEVFNEVDKQLIKEFYEN